MKTKPPRRPVLALLTFAMLAVVAGVQEGVHARAASEQSSSAPPAQPLPSGPSAELQTQAARTLASIQDVLKRPERAPQTFVQSLIEFGRPVLIALIYLLGLIAFLWAVRRLLCAFPRQGTLVAFDDLSVPRAERPDKSRVLTQSILESLQNPRPVQMSDLQMDIMPGIDESGFGGLQAMITMSSVLEYEPSDNPMKIAGVEFSLRDVLGLVRRHFTRPHNQYLEGWLTADANGIDVGARLLDSAGRAVLSPQRQDQVCGLQDGDQASRARTPNMAEEDRCEWRVRRIGAEARAEAVADLAAQILVATGNSTLTNSWQSFRHFHKALQLRNDQQSDDRSDRLALARGHLERAVGYDPANWIARFSLALTLSRDNEADVALQHFEILEDVVERAWKAVGTMPRDPRAYRQLCKERPAFFNAVTHLEGHPECAFLILYNKAIALVNSKATPPQPPKPGFREQAANIFAQIARLDGGGPVELEWPYPAIASDKRLSKRSRVELSLYASSALADLLASAPPCLPAPPGLEGMSTRVAQIDALRQQVEGIRELKKEEHWPSLQTARAVTLTAYASALRGAGRPADARDALHAALAAQPRFVNAAALLAELYIGPPPLSPDWSMRAEGLLNRALEINPSCEHAKRLLAKLYADPAVDKAAEALNLLRPLTHNRKAHLQRAELCLSPAIASPTEAVHCLTQYIALSGTMDDAAYAVLNRLLSREEADQPDPEKRWANLAQVLLEVEPQAGILNAERIRDAFRRIQDHIEHTQVV
jgi:tetratricopeptide (TPR) repeat protein